MNPSTAATTPSPISAAPQVTAPGNPSTTRPDRVPAAPQADAPASGNVPVTRSVPATGNVPASPAGVDQTAPRTDLSPDAPSPDTQSPAQAPRSPAARQAERLLNRWLGEAQEARRLYPDLDLRAELRDPRFATLLRADFDVRSAYEALHFRQLLPAALRAAARDVSRRLTDRVLADRDRPTENGARSQSAAVLRTDVASLSRADRQAIIRRVQKGEVIRF